MTILHKILLGVEIYAIAASALVLLSILFRLIHKIVGTPARPMTPENIQAAMARASNETRLHRWLDGFDIFLNVTFLNGQNDETMSAHCWRASLKGHWWGIAMNWWLGGFQLNHGWQAAAGDLQRAINRVNTEKEALGIE